MFRVYADNQLFDLLVPWWGQVYSCLTRNVQSLPPLSADIRRSLKEMCEVSMARNIAYDYYDRLGSDSPPCISDHPLSDDDEPPTKKRCYSDT